MIDLGGRVALVTGVSRGIGGHIARGFAAAGAWNRCQRAVVD